VQEPKRQKMFWAFLDITTFEAAEIMLPQNVWIQLSSNAMSVQKNEILNTEFFVYSYLKNFCCSACLRSKDQKLHTSVSIINLVNIIAIITTVAMV